MITTPDYQQIPAGYNVTGTCGKCGGPVVQPQIYVPGSTRPEHCYSCNAIARQPIPPTFGTVREMR